jgi:hypothetical protein
MLAHDLKCAELPSITHGQTLTVLGDCLPKQGVKVVLALKEKQGIKAFPCGC